jgi:hypothetical protein
METIIETIASAKTATAIGAVAPVIVGLVEVLKAIGLPSRWAPVAAIGCGIAICAGAALASGSEAGARWFEAGLSGIVAGLAASGLYSGSKKLTEEVKHG